MTKQPHANRLYPVLPIPRQGSCSVASGARSLVQQSVSIKTETGSSQNFYARKRSEKFRVPPLSVFPFGPPFNAPWAQGPPVILSLSRPGRWASATGQDPTDKEQNNVE